MIPENFRRGEPRAKSKPRPQKRAARKNTRVNSTASFVGRFNFVQLEATLCSDPISRSEHPAGRPAVAGLRAAWRGEKQKPGVLRG
jgi:hypothetical protein